MMAKPDWAKLQADYEAGGQTIAVLLRKYGITRSAFNYRRKKNGWIKKTDEAPAHSASRPDVMQEPDIDTAHDESAKRALINRLYNVVDQKIADLEQSVAQSIGRDDGALGEKQSRSINVIARTLEKLFDLTRAQAGEGEETEAGDRDHEQLRAELAKRLGRLGG